MPDTKTPLHTYDGNATFVTQQPVGWPYPPAGPLSGASAVAVAGVVVWGDDYSVFTDSRAIDQHTTASQRGRKSAKSWVNWFMAYLGQPKRLVFNYGQSGQRTDEYITQARIASIIEDASTFVIASYPAINDISQAVGGYTDADGVAVTTSNVAARASDRLIRAINQITAAGKPVMAQLEYGTGTLAASGVAAVHEFNRFMRTAFSGRNDVVLIDATPIMWVNPVPGPTISIKPGYVATNDGFTHAETRGGQAVGKFVAQTIAPRLFPRRKKLIGFNTAVANVSQLFANRGFATLTGGAAAGNTTVIGNTPANCRIASTTGGATVTCTVTSRPSPSGTGNIIRLEFVTSGTDSAVTTNFIMQDIPTAGLGVNDKFVGGAHANFIELLDATPFWSTQLVSNTGTEDSYDLFGTQTWANEMADVQFQSLPDTFLAGSASVSSINMRLSIAFAGAGKRAVVEIEDPYLYRLAA